MHENLMDLRQINRRLEDPLYRPMIGENLVRSWWDTFRMVFLLGDTVTVRAILMVASLGQALGFFLPLHTIERPYFTDMRWLPGGSWSWGSLYLLHAIGQWWRFRSGPNLVAGFVVNFYGFVLWTFTTLLGCFASGTYSPTTALEWTVIAALGAALIRTGNPSDRLSP